MMMYYTNKPSEGVGFETLNSLVLIALVVVEGLVPELTSKRIVPLNWH
jgi:hypothetical protein